MSSRDSVVAWPLGDRAGGEPGGDGGAVGSHWLSLADIGRRLGVPASDVRDYVEHHGAFIEVMHFGQRTLVGRSSLPTLEAIRRCYETGADADAVNKEMARRRGRTKGTAAAAARGEATEAAPAAGTAVTPAPAPAAVPQRASPREVVLPTYDVANEIIGLRREVAEVRRTMHALNEALAARDEALRTVLSALAELVATQDNERRLAEGERDRQNATEHRQTLEAVNELLGIARRRNRWRL